jgi:hypothetical protein
MFPRTWTWPLIAEFALYVFVLAWLYATVGLSFWTTELNRVCPARLKGHERLEHIRATCAEPCGAIRLREEPNLER